MVKISGDTWIVDVLQFFPGSKSGVRSNVGQFLEEMKIVGIELCSLMSKIQVREYHEFIPDE